MLRNLAITALALLAFAMPAHADDGRVAIGVIDTKTTVAEPGADVQVHYREFRYMDWPAGVEQEAIGFTHGDLVVQSIVDTRAKSGDSRPYDIYVANPFAINPAKHLTLTWGAFDQTLDWFKSHGVKVISTTFAAQQTNGYIDAFIARAKAEGMVVVASVGNGGTATMPYPAASPDVIAVDGYHYLTHRSRDAAFLTRADAIFDGSTRATTRPFDIETGEDADTRAMGKAAPADKVHGSSFAAAKAAAYLAAHLPESAGLDQAREMLRSDAAGANKPIDPGSRPIQSASASSSVQVAVAGR